LGEVYSRTESVTEYVQRGGIITKLPLHGKPHRQRPHVPRRKTERRQTPDMRQEMYVWCDWVDDDEGTYI